MSTNEVLYIKGMHLSESERDIDEEDEDIWDDRKLNDAYDKALKMANAEVAKRIAMSTNTQAKDQDDSNKNKNIPSKSHHSKSSHKKDQMQWKAGMHCRAVYEGDGLEYEAFLLRIINDKECIVRFLGYNNSEIVAINSLKASLGKVERTRQIEDALVDRTDDGSSEISNMEKMECSDRALSVASSDTHPKKKKSGKKKKPKQKAMNDFNIPDIHMPMPDFSQLRNLGSLDMPLPPPPTALRASDCEEQAISSMLLSWYMSGYYTGLYQGMRRAKGHKN